MPRPKIDPFVVRGQITIRRDGGVAKRKFGPTLREGLKSSGRLWHEKILPIHFKKKGAKRYNYKPRGEAYQRRKLRRRGAVIPKDVVPDLLAVPLVFSGNLRKILLRRQDVRVFKDQLRVVLKGPRYLFQFRKDLDQPDKAAELVAITQDEIKRLAKNTDKEMTRRFRVMKELKKRRI